MYERKARIIGDPHLVGPSVFHHEHKGVPQEGVLSPLLYNLYVSDIFDGIPEEISESFHGNQFADDTKVIITRNSASRICLDS
ncbi:hypothetical protein ANTRET_LOCUS5623 [Anthophora retusa]